MKIILTAGALALAFSAAAAAQDGERRCCHLTEGVWLDGTYTPEACTALGEDYAPQGDGRTMMCTPLETTDIPGNPPGAPGSPGGGDGGDGDGAGGDGDGAGGGGSGSGDGGGGAGVQMREDASLAEQRFTYDEVGAADLAGLGHFLERTEMQRDFCDDMLRTGADDRAAGQAIGEQATTCFTNLRGNAHLVTQNAGRMRNDRSIDPSLREEAAHIMQDAGAIRDHADAVLDN